MTDQPTVTKEEWIAALRSGEYKQYRGGLTADSGHATQKARFLDVKNTSFCCLGVFMSLEYRKGITNASFSCVDKITGDKDLSTKLINKNDGCNGERPHTFSEIADYLESLP